MLYTYHYTTLVCDLQGTLRDEMQKGSYRIDTGGDKEARTPDLGSAIAALYQLSYIPVTRRMIPYCGNIVKSLF